MTKPWLIFKNINLYRVSIYIYIWMKITSLFHFFVLLLVFVFRVNVESYYLTYVFLCFATLFDFVNLFFLLHSSFRKSVIFRTCETDLPR